MSKLKASKPNLDRLSANESHLQHSEAYTNSIDSFKEAFEMARRALIGHPCHGSPGRRRQKKKKEF